MNSWCSSVPAHPRGAPLTFIGAPAPSSQPFIHSFPAPSRSPRSLGSHRLPWMPLLGNRESDTPGNPSDRLFPLWADNGAALGRQGTVTPAVPSNSSLRQTRGWPCRGLYFQSRVYTLPKPPELPHGINSVILTIHTGNGDKLLPCDKQI